MKTTDILAAAADLDVALTPHARAVARARAAVGRIELCWMRHAIAAA